LLLLVLGTCSLWHYMFRPSVYLNPKWIGYCKHMIYAESISFLTVLKF